MKARRARRRKKARRKAQSLSVSPGVSEWVVVASRDTQDHRAHAHLRETEVWYLSIHSLPSSQVPPTREVPSSCFCPPF